jgi:chromosome segregation ATPase
MNVNEEAILVSAAALVIALTYAIVQSIRTRNKSDGIAVAFAESSNARLKNVEAQLERAHEAQDKSEDSLRKALEHITELRLQAQETTHALQLAQKDVEKERIQNTVLRSEVARLEGKVTALEAENATLKAELTTMKARMAAQGQGL